MSTIYQQKMDITIPIRQYTGMHDFSLFLLIFFVVLLAFLVMHWSQLPVISVG